MLGAAKGEVSASVHVMVVIESYKNLICCLVEQAVNLIKYNNYLCLCGV